MEFIGGLGSKRGVAFAAVFGIAAALSARECPFVVFARTFLALIAWKLLCPSAECLYLVLLGPWARP